MVNKHFLHTIYFLSVRWSSFSITGCKIKGVGVALTLVVRRGVSSGESKGDVVSGKGEVFLACFGNVCKIYARRRISKCLLLKWISSLWVIFFQWVNGKRGVGEITKQNSGEKERKEKGGKSITKDRKKREERERKKREWKRGKKIMKRDRERERDNKRKRVEREKRERKKKGEKKITVHTTKITTCLVYIFIYI